jgi:hypothetical protein
MSHSRPEQGTWGLGKGVATLAKGGQLGCKLVTTIRLLILCP